MPDPPGWSRGDFHIHTRYSDGIYTVRSIAEAARNRGLQAIIITDHDDDIPVNETRRIGRGINEDNWPRYKRECSAVAGIVGITVIPGVEFGRNEGHYLAYDLKRFEPVTKRCGQNTIEHTARLGGFGYIAHPTILWPIAWDDWDVTGFTGLEVWNAKVPPGFRPIADEKWDYLLPREGKEGRKVFGIGNSDAHHIEEIGAVFQLCQNREASRQTSNSR